MMKRQDDSRDELRWQRLLAEAGVDGPPPDEAFLERLGDESAKEFSASAVSGGSPASEMPRKAQPAPRKRRPLVLRLALAASLLIACGAGYLFVVSDDYEVATLRRGATDAPMLVDFGDNSTAPSDQLERASDQLERASEKREVGQSTAEVPAPAVTENMSGNGYMGSTGRIIVPRQGEIGRARKKTTNVATGGEQNYEAGKKVLDLHSILPDVYPSQSTQRGNGTTIIGGRTFASNDRRTTPTGTILFTEDFAEGIGPGQGGDKYTHLAENPFREVSSEPLSTFSIDVDTASYSKTRMYLMQHRRLPPPDAVRIEELVNYFSYDYEGPKDDHPFAAHIEVAACPWQPKHRLVRVGIKGKPIEQGKRPASNLVFLLDVSGSMDQPNKLPLVVQGMKMLVDQLGENDRVAIVVYAGSAGMVLPSTTGDQKRTILSALEQLRAGGSTNGGQGIRLAYQLALDNFIQGGVNRVLLCTDGDFNVGTTSTGQLVRLTEENAKNGIFLSVLGFGMGNHRDEMLETISNKANGNYAFIDTKAEARKVLVEQMGGTLVTIAKDVKIQVEFNPNQVAAYRLVGHANRMLAAEDFNDDKKDAGEIGAGHTVTALYEIVPAGTARVVKVTPVDDLKYQTGTRLSQAAGSGELLTLKLRYKRPDGDKSTLLSFPVKDAGKGFAESSDDFQFSAAVASFGMLLRDSKHKGNATCDAVLEIATAGLGKDEHGYRAEFLELVKRAKELGR